jgi:hypothetical protein
LAVPCGYRQQKLPPSPTSASTFASGISTVQTIGLQDNQDITSNSGMAGNHPTVTITDPGPLQANTTYYYRVVAVNFTGATPSTNIVSATTGAPANTPNAFEAYFYQNEWWGSTPQNTSGIMNTGTNTGVGGTLDPVNLTATESGLVSGPIATQVTTGSDGGNGSVESVGNNTPKYPDPASAIGPDNFSDVFTGQITITTASTPGTPSTYYTFAANTDDDGYMYVDDKLVSAYPGGHGASNNETNYPIALTAGQHDIEFFESNGGGGWQWNWLYTGPDTNNAALAPISAVRTPSVINSLADPVVAPTTFTVASTSNPTQALVTLSNNNTSAIRYVLQRSTDPTFSTGVTSIDFGLPSTPANSASYPATTTYTDTGLNLGATYYYRVIVENYDGSATDSTDSSTTKPAQISTANQYPPVPSVVADQDVNGNIQVSFPAETFAGITGYQLLRSVNGGTYTAVTGSPFAQGAGPYTFTDPAAGLTAGSTYQYEVIVAGSGTPANSPAAISNSLYYVTNTVVNHATGFTGEADLTLGGNGVYTPVVTANGQLQISSTVNNEATNSYETTPVGIDSDFSTSFDFQLTNPNADGFAFVIQNEGKNINGNNGGGFGYTGVTPSLAVIFNMYNGVTQTQLGVNGNLIGTAADMSGTLGNAFHNLNSSNATDVFQVSLSYTASTQTLYEAVRDTTTGLGYSTSYSLASYGLAANYLLGPGSDDYVGFTAGTGGANAQQNVLDWTFNDAVSTVTAPPPTSVTATEDVNGNIQVSFPAPPANGLTSTTYQILRSVNGGAYAAIGSPIPYSSTATAYTYQDTASGLTSGKTYQYEAILSGTTPASPATSNSVYYVYGPLVAHTGATPFTSADNGTDLQFNTGGGDAATVTASNQLQLTDGSGGDDTSVFTTNTVQITNNWQTSFDFEITNPGADGFTFTLQNVGNTTVGNGGGSLAYAGGGFAGAPGNATGVTSIAFAFNQYNGVTQTAVGADGALAPYVDMSSALGNAFHTTPANATTDTFQVSLAYNITSGDFFQTVRDTRTGLAFSQTITPTIYAGYLSALGGTTVTPAQAQAAIAALFSAPVYVGFTGATGGVTSTQTVNDWTFNSPAVVTSPPPTVVSVTPEDSAGNGIAAGSIAKGQRSMETQIAVVFSEPVNLASGAFTLNLVNQYGGGENNGAADSAITGVLGTPTNPSGDGVTWIIPILSTGTVSDPTSTLNGTSESYHLKGTGGGISGASLNNGVYDLNVTASDVTATGGGPAMAANYTSATWHRLYGDVDNARRVFNTEYSTFLLAFTSTTVSGGATNYNQDLDYDGDGRVFNSDYSELLLDFGSTRLYTEPQS